MADLNRPSEPTIHSFIVKIFVESAPDDTPPWHGYVTHVPGGERRYLTNLRQIRPFIASYLGPAGRDRMPLRWTVAELRRRFRSRRR